MKIRKIEWRNFSSYGNRNQIIEFENSSLYQIVGENGAGKTSISQAISFVLYGKVEGKRLSDIPNRINGNTWVKIELESNGNNVIVERGLEPSIFNLRINGVEYDKANSRSVQDYLTDDILGIPQHVFNNTISLSINDFKSFIKMSPQDKRAIIDKIFGFYILNQMRNVIKDEMRKIKNDVDNISGKIESLKDSISSSQDELQILADKISEDNTLRISSLNQSLDTFFKLQEVHSSRVTEFTKEESEFYKQLREHNRILIETRSRKKEIENKITVYSNSTCPTCGGDLSSNFYTGIKDGLSQELEKTKKIISKYEKIGLSFNEKEESIREQKNDIISKGSKIESKILSIKHEIQRTQTESIDSQMESINNIIDGMSSDIRRLQTERFKGDERTEWLKKMDEVLGERGVKQAAISTILPSLNAEISDLMIQMGLPYQIVFDHEFNATIYHMGMEIPVQTLSTGEMKKADFIVLISILKLMKIKFSSINLLFLDELFSSVDSEGIYTILGILKKISSEMGLNIFVINHAPMPHEIFDWKIDVSKINGFSSLSVSGF